MMLKGDCLFCRIIKKEIPAKIVFEDTNVLAFEDIRPQAPVHIIIIPKRHIERLSDLTDGDGKAAADLVLAAKNIARQKNVHDSGYRVVINCDKDGGQAVFHLHLHLLGGRALAWPPG